MLNSSKLKRIVANTPRNDITRCLVPSDHGNWFLSAGIISRNAENPGVTTFTHTNQYGITYLYSGEGEYEDDLGNRAKLKSGYAFHRHANRTLTLRPTGRQQWIGFIVTYPSPYFEAMKQTVPGIPDAISWETGVQLELLEEVLRIKELLKDPDEFSRNAAIGRMQTLCLKFYRCIGGHQTLQNQEDPYERAKDELSQISPNLPSVPQIADKCGLGYETFRKGFKARFGESPASYRNRLRIEKASEQLMRTNKTVSEICEQLGYQDLFLFSRQFKKATSLSPQQYRKLHSGSA